ncbi:MAG: hypothetical protein QXL43_02580 [Methanolinea sp.]
MQFLKDLICDYGIQFSQPYRVGQVNEKLRQFFQKDEVNFVAIDGTCSADPFSDFMVFFAAAYGVRGKIHIQSSRLAYERWSMDQDVSLVAYVPVPYAQSGDVTDSEYETFTVDDRARINLSSIHTRLMQLAEIYLAYELARSPLLSGPNLILMDLSLSSVMMSTEGYLEKVRLFGHPLGSRRLRFEDGLVVYAHPFSDAVGVPTLKRYQRWAYLVKALAGERERKISFHELCARTGLSEREWATTLHQPFTQRLVSVRNAEIEAKFDFSASWYDSVRLFEDFCDRLFHRREAEALLYPIENESGRTMRWMSPEDVSFLVSIGIRALIEQCWEKNILLLGISKDSASSYFSRQYIGVLRECGAFPSVAAKPLPWTDRMLLESLSAQLDDLSAPWATTEFDSVFMSLRVEEVDGKREIRGNRGNIVNRERVFARSLAQFFKQTRGRKPLMGHVIFIDRLVSPRLDRQFLSSLDGPVIQSAELGKIRPVHFGTNAGENEGQLLSIWLLKILTRNLFPEIIGYPDPLHKADWGAKSVRRRVDRLIKSSEITFRSRPLTKTFREIRDSAGR